MLLNQASHEGVKRSGSLTNLASKLDGSNMEVEASGLKIFVSSEQGNVIKSHACAFEGRQAMMPECMRSQPGKMKTEAKLLNDIIQGT